MKTKIFYLGAQQEIGKSCFVVERGNDIIVVDMGIKFPESFLIGVSGTIPNYHYLKANQKKIRAVIISHGHEDHIGGLPYFLRHVHVPKVYIPRIGLEYLKAKLFEHKLNIDGELIEVNEDVVFKSDEFTVDFYVTTHSIPDAYSMRIRTADGVIVYTGDFRFDYTPIGQIANFERIKRFGREGVDLLFSDGTNAMIPKHSPTEQIILKDIGRFIGEAKKKVIVTIFASNVTRIKAIIELAKEHKKKVVLMGRSIVKGMKIAFRLGYINVENNIIVPANKMSGYKDEEIMVICTGSQGEEQAALNRMSQNKNNNIKIKGGDTIIFSSSPIPGNRIQVEELINRLSRLGADIKEHNVDGIIHTSGHAYHDEHFKLLTDLKPKYFVPFHGEYRMSVAHINTAIEAGVEEKNTWPIVNGEVMYLENHVLTRAPRAEWVDADPIYVDGLSTSTINPQILKDREQLANSGVVAVVGTINKSKKTIVKKLRIISRGMMYVKTSRQLLFDSQRLVHGSLLYTIKNNDKWTEQSLKKLVENKLSHFLHQKLRRKPIIITQLTIVD